MSSHKVREAAGVFRARQALDTAIDALLLAGFDRADIDLMADGEAVCRRLGGGYVPAVELADVPGVPRREIVTRDDFALTAAVVAGSLAAVGALLGAFVAIARDGSLLSVVVTAILFGVVCGGLGLLPLARRLWMEPSRKLELQLAADGLVLWVRVRSADDEDKAQEILLASGAEAVHIHEIEVEKEAEDPPLSSLRPDPWLGDERLGRP